MRRENGCLAIIGTMCFAICMTVMCVAIGERIIAWSPGIAPAPDITARSIADAMIESERQELRDRAKNHAEAARMTSDDDQAVHDFLAKANAAAREAKRERYRKLNSWRTNQERSEVHRAISKALEKLAGR